MTSIVIIIAIVAILAALWQHNADRVRQLPREPRQLFPRLP